MSARLTPIPTSLRPASDDLTEFGRRGPRKFGVDHAMAVEAEESQVADAHPAFAPLISGPRR